MNKKHPYSFGVQGQSGGKDPAFISPDGLHSLGDLAQEGDNDLDLRNANYMNAQNPGVEEAAQKVVIPMEGVTDDELRKLAQERLCPHCKVKQEADEARLRALAEVDNTRKRLQREKDEHVAYAAEAVLADIIPALDNLDLALQHAGTVEACKNLVVGVEMTKKILLESLKRHGLDAIGSLGDPFDPAVHEAVNTEAHPDIPHDCVCGLLSKGYTLKGRLLRPAKVIVSRK